MIQVDRSVVPRPKTLDPKRVNNVLADARRFYRRPIDERRQERYSWEELWLAGDVVAALDKVFVGKCAYCEQPISEQPVIDHFRPLANASGGSESAPDHYWWLAYEWTNIYAACSSCSYHKGDKFPIDQAEGTKKPGRAPLEATSEQLAAEPFLLLDPCEDSPLEHLQFDFKNGSVEPRSQRGEVTIEVLSLNRTDLVSLRRRSARETDQLLRKLSKLVNDGRALPLGKGLGELIGTGRPFQGQTLYQIAPWIKRYQARLKRMLPPDVLERLGVAAPPRGKQKTTTKRPSKMFQTLAQALSPFVGQALNAVAGAGVAGAGPAIVTGEWAAATPSRRRTTPRHFRTALIEKVTIRNFRALTNMRLDFPQAAVLSEGTLRPPATLSDRGESHSETVSAPWLMLLGENGTGKSSILQAIALTLAGQKARKRLGVVPDDVLRIGAAEGSVRIDLSGEREPVTLSFKAGDSDFTATPAEPGIQVFAYGATRLLPRRKARPARDPGQVRVRNLFDAFTPLVDAEKWLGDLWRQKESGKDPESFDNQALAFKDLLSISRQAKLTGGEDGQPLTIRMNGADLSFDKLSDGYQSVVALAADIMKGLYTRHRARRERARVETLEGLVLLDEIGAHLHPRWKMEVVEQLRRSFPRIQFVATTHEPLCLRGLGDAEVTVLKRGSRGGIHKVADLPNIRGLRVDQLLTSEHFGLNSTVDPELERWIDEYYHLLRVRRRTPNQKARMTQLQEMIDGRQQLGTTERERLLLEAIDWYLARKPTVSSATGRRKLKARTRAKLKRIWGEA